MHLSVTAHPRGLSIATDSVTVGPGLRGEMERFLARVSGASPTQLVSPAGEFLGLDQVTKFRAHLLSGLDSVLSTSDAPVEARRAVANMVTEQMLQASAADQWSSMVGFWADADLELGETLELRMVTVPDVAKVREAAGKLLESLAPGARDSVLAAIQSVQVMNEVVLVTRPESLAPQWMRKVRRTTARVREGDAVQEDIKITRYHWRD